MAQVIYAKSTDGVVLRFEDIDILKIWVETGRLERDAVYLNGKEWRPLAELLDTAERDSGLPETSPKEHVFLRSAVSQTKGALVSKVENRLEERVVEKGYGAREPAKDMGEQQAEDTVVTPIPKAFVDDRKPDTAKKTTSAGWLDGGNRTGESATRRVEDIPIEPQAKPEAKVDEHIELWASEPDPFEEAEKKKAIRKKVLVAVFALVCASVVVVLVWQVVLPWMKPAVIPVSKPSSALVQGAGPRASEGGGSVDVRQVGEASGSITSAVPQTGTVTSGSEGQPKDESKEKAAINIENGTKVGDENKEEVGKRADETVVLKEGPAGAVGAGRGQTGQKEAQEAKEAGNGTTDEMSYSKHMIEGHRYLKKDPKRAMAHFQMASRLKPDAVEPVSKMGDCSLAMGEIDVALDYYQRALGMMQGYGPAMIGIARGFARKGNKEQARLWYQKYLDSNPQGSQAEEARRFLADQGL
jgi:hypothetical protein